MKTTYKYYRNKLIYFLSIFLLFIVFIVITETYLSVTDYSDNFEANNPNNADYPWSYDRFIRLRLHNGFIEELIHPSAARVKRGLENKEIRFKTDRNGFIEPSLVHDQPDKTIVFMGGSTTENMFVDEKKRFPYLAGRLVEKETGLKINTINASRSSNHVMHNINILINVILKFEPNYVVLMNNINDYYLFLDNEDNLYWNTDVARSLIINRKTTGVKKRFELYHEIKQIVRSMIPHTYLRLVELKLFFTNATLKENSLKASKIDQKENHLTEKDFVRFEKTFKQALSSFVAVCKAHEIKVVLMTQPSRFTMPSQFPYDNNKLTYKQYRGLHRSFNQQIRNVTNDNELEMIDLEALIPQSKKFMWDNIHFNDEGSVYAANIIASYISKYIKNQ